jgi:hypothetical protein
MKSNLLRSALADTVVSGSTTKIVDPAIAPKAMFTASTEK